MYDTCDRCGSFINYLNERLALVSCVSVQVDELEINCHAEQCRLCSDCRKKLEEFLKNKEG